MIDNRTSRIERNPTLSRRTSTNNTYSEDSLSIYSMLIFFLDNSIIDDVDARSSESMTSCESCASRGDGELEGRQGVARGEGSLRGETAAEGGGGEVVMEVERRSHWKLWRGENWGV